MSRFEQLYRLKKQDIERSSTVFTEAFKKDPVWAKIFQNMGMPERRIFFQGPARYCLQYGGIYASTDNIEGVMPFVPSRFADVTFLHALRTGSLKPYDTGGSLKLVKLMFKLNPIFKPLEEARKVTMSGENTFT